VPHGRFLLLSSACRSKKKKTKQNKTKQNKTKDNRREEKTKLKRIVFYPKELLSEVRGSC